jgi:hypothetical protein
LSGHGPLFSDGLACDVLVHTRFLAADGGPDISKCFWTGHFQCFLQQRSRSCQAHFEKSGFEAA